MLKNYLTLAFRNLAKRKLYSFINIFGLATGVAVCLVILKYVDFQLSYDDFHENEATLYRTITTTHRSGEPPRTSPASGYAQGPVLAEDIPEIKHYVRTHPMYGDVMISNNDAAGEPLRFQEEHVQFVDSTFLDVFTYKAVEGNLSTALDRPDAIVITRSMSEKYFGKATSPLGKTLSIAGGWLPGDFQVTAVIEDVPDNTHFNFSFLLPLQKLLRENEQYKEDDGWQWSNFVTYVQLHAAADLATVHDKVEASIQRRRGEIWAKAGKKNVVTFQPIRDIHLNPGYANKEAETMSGNSIYFFLIISVFIMAIAWVNYINLSTARAMERAREVGIKKAVGAFRSQLITQFIFESVLVNLLAVGLALVLAMLLLPVLGAIVDKHFAFDFADYRLWLVLTGLFVTGSVVSGAYPAFVLSSFKTVVVLKGNAVKAGEKFSLRKALVVFQFVSSLVLIAGTFAIYRQLMFMRSRDKGFATEQMLVVRGPRAYAEEGIEERLITFKNELKKIAAVTHVTTSGSIPGAGTNWGTTMRKVGDPVDMAKSGSVTWVDPDFLDAYQMELVAGKNWNPDVASDMEAMIVNEAALAAYGLGTPEQALEKRMVLSDGDTIEIIGVLKNYNWNSLKAAYSPMLLAAWKVSRRHISIHLSGTSMQQSIQQIEEQYKATFPGNAFNYYFLDDFFNRQYKDDQQFGRIFSMFAILAIVIACLGLWGLASFTTVQKLKEISIRKVLGASTTGIMSLLSVQFLKLVLIASIIAIPLTWYGIDSWLNGFAFRIGLQWDMFVVPVLVLGAIALLTVSVQILKGASSNPARILRSE